MAECGCSKAKNQIPSLGICEVCRLLDNDTQTKEVYFCDFCEVNICCKHRDQYDKRAFAALLKLFSK